MFSRRALLSFLLTNLGAWAQPASPTFTAEIAPIIFKNCSGCHRPGQTAPFSLLNYTDVRKRASDIQRAVSLRAMPPWLPEPGFGHFENEQRLQPAEIDRINDWIKAGAPEGNSADLPQMPKWQDQWQLGKPDLILRMPQPYTLSADGPDEYRNFVIQTALTQSRFVRGVEFRPANPKIIHHAFVKIDRTRQSRRLEADNHEVGFLGIITPAEIPDGHFLGWQPGRVPTFGSKGLEWRLDPGNDIVLQMHLRRTGKPEQVQAEVGLFFTDVAPTNTPFRLQLASLSLDIPAGETNFVVQDHFTIPIDTHALAILPHAHYLAREMRAWADLPNGKTEPLLYIKNWDFDWHADYRYQTPIFFPAGTRVSMRYSYDNSTNNLRNPNHPPKPVSYGPQATDEMAQLFLQLLPARKAELPRLKRDADVKLAQLMRVRLADRLKKNPNDPEALIDLSLLLLTQGQVTEAEQDAQKALHSQPNNAAAHYQLGLVYRQENKLDPAKREFETTIHLDPKQSKAYGNLGFIHLEKNELPAARQCFENALRLNPDDDTAREALAEVQTAAAKK